MKYEALSRAEENEFGITSTKEIISILKHIAGNATPVGLLDYRVAGNYFIMTTLLGANETGLWLEQSANERDNKRILESDNLAFASTHLQVKVQFVFKQARSAEYRGFAAFNLPLPECIYRLERRESNRIGIATVKLLRCAIPIDAAKVRQVFEVDLIDISAEGMKLSYAEKDIELVQGRAYENCQIKLPELGTISFTMIVRNIFSLPTQSGHTIKRAGCQFVNLNPAFNNSLQRYLSNIQQRQYLPGAN